MLIPRLRPGAAPNPFFDSEVFECDYCAENGHDFVDDKVFYRVCIGSFNNKDNAVNLKNEAISKGFKDTYIYTT